jgi:3',5'-cyclic AMP phosphodiesterase CpdA
MAERTTGHEEEFVLAQLSDIHCGDPRFDPDLMERTIEDINALAPDVVVVAGDLTTAGYREEFEEAREYLERIECERVGTILGNHDCRNVGWVHYERLFAKTHHAKTFDVGEGADGAPAERIRIVATNSNRADINEGEISLRRYGWIRDSFEGDFTFRIFCLHHHLVPIPGTGRERSVVLDGGDVLWLLGQCKVDLVLSGHKHVPWVWEGGRAFIVTSGTAATWRTRGDTPPSYNIIRITDDEIEFTFRNLVGEPDTVQRFSRAARTRRVSMVTS